MASKSQHSSRNFSCSGWRTNGRCACRTRDKYPGMARNDYSSLSAIQFAMAFALIKTATPMTNGIELSTIGKIFTGMGCLGTKHCVRYNAVSNKPITMTLAAIRRTSIKAPRWDESMNSDVFRQWRFQRRILRVRTDIAQIICRATEFQIRRAGLRAVGGNGHGGQIIFSVRQRKAVTE